MRLLLLVFSAPLLAQSPAALPHDMSSFGCTHFDGKTCDQAPAPPPDYNPLIGSWVRFSLLRNGFSVQPPDAPLYVKFSSDGYWSMMEFPADRPKANRPLPQLTPQELFVRFENLDGGWGDYTQNGMLNIRHHKAGLGPGGGESDQIREWSFEGNILLLAGTGGIRSPQARFRKLPNQPLGTKALAGTWQRTALSVNGAPVQEPAPLHLILGEDGWFHETQMPAGRSAPRNKPREQWTTAEYVTAYQGMSASRGTYNATSTVLIRKHIADADPNLEGRDDTGVYALRGDILTVTGTDAAGRKNEATYQRMKPFNVYAPPAPRP